MAKLDKQDLELILNACLNEAMCRKQRIKHPNSNTIAKFVANWINKTDLSVSINEPTSTEKSIGNEPVLYLAKDDERSRFQKDLDDCYANEDEEENEAELFCKGVIHHTCKYFCDMIGCNGCLHKKFEAK